MVMVFIFTIVKIMKGKKPNIPWANYRFMKKSEFHIQEEMYNYIRTVSFTYPESFIPHLESMGVTND